MKTINKKEKTTIELLRDIRDKIGEEIKDMDSKQLTQYLKKQKTLHPASFWDKK